MAKRKQETTQQLLERFVHEYNKHTLELAGSTEVDYGYPTTEPLSKETAIVLACVLAQGIVEITDWDEGGAPTWHDVVTGDAMVEVNAYFDAGGSEVVPQGAPGYVAAVVDKMLDQLIPRAAHVEALATERLKTTKENHYGKK